LLLGGHWFRPLTVSCNQNVHECTHRCMQICKTLKHMHRYACTCTHLHTHTCMHTCIAYPCSMHCTQCTHLYTHPYTQTTHRFPTALITLFWGGAYGSFQSRGQVRAAAASLHHSSQQCWILNPLMEAREPTCILKDISGVLTH